MIKDCELKIPIIMINLFEFYCVLSFTDKHNLTVTTVIPNIEFNLSKICLVTQVLPCLQAFANQKS